MTDKRSTTSRENGKKGGRPKGYAALQAEKARIFIAEQVEQYWGPIVKKAIQQAIKGDKYAREWLYDRGYHKPRQTVGLEGGEEGEPIEFKDVGKMSDKEINEYLRKKLSRATK